MSMTSLAQVIDAIALKIERDRDAGPASLREWHAALLHHLTQPAQSVDVLEGDELAEFAKTIAEFNDCESTETPHHVLMRWAEMGLLDCTLFEVTTKGQQMLAAALQEAAR